MKKEFDKDAAYIRVMKKYPFVENLDKILIRIAEKNSKKEKKKRDNLFIKAEMIRLRYVRGWNLKRIGAKYNISSQRVLQIIHSLLNSFK